MFKIFKKTNFNTIEFLNYLEENEFNIYNIGGTFNSEFTLGAIFKFKNHQYELMGNNQKFITCNPSTFINSIKSLETDYQYQLFGNN